MKLLVVGVIIGIFTGILGVRLILSFAKKHDIFVLKEIVRLLLGDDCARAAKFSPEILEEIRRDSPEIAEVIELEPAVPVESQPAEFKEEQADEIMTAKTDEEARDKARKFIKNPDVADAVVVLSRWTPKNCDYEEDYQSSFNWYARRNGYSGQRISEQERLPLIINEQDPLRVAIPDFILGDSSGPDSKKVLVELKADLTTSTASDRALGQMLRYLLAWKKRPALLVVCGDTPPDIRELIRINVESWRERLKMPVSVFWKSDDEADVEKLSLMPAKTEE